MLDPDKGRVAATDGHRVVVVSIGDRVDHDRAVRSGRWRLISREDIESLLACTKKEGASIRLVLPATATNEVGRAEFSRPGEAGPLSVLVAKLVDDIGARVDDIVASYRYDETHAKDTKGLARLAFNAEYLAAFALVQRACPPLMTGVGKKRVETPVFSMLFFPARADDPMLARVDCALNSCTWRVWLMPCRM
jgi:hypothetical protein